VSIVYAGIDECVAMLEVGKVAAVVSDRAVLLWYSSYYQVANSYVGPLLNSNPFAFVYKSSNTALSTYINPSIIAATQTDSAWIPLYSAIALKYFGNDNGGSPPVFVTLVNQQTLIASLAMLGFAILYAFVNGDWGPGISRPQWLRQMIQQPSESGKGALSEEELALQGDELSFNSLVINQLKGVRYALGLEETYTPAAKADSAEPPCDDEAPSAKELTPLHAPPALPLAGGDAGLAMLPVLAELRKIRHEMAQMKKKMMEMQQQQRIPASSASGAIAAPLGAPSGGDRPERRPYRPRTPGSAPRSVTWSVPPTSQHSTATQQATTAAACGGLPQIPLWGLGRS